MKKLLATIIGFSVCHFSQSVFSATCGAYIGLGGGYGRLGTPSNNVFAAPDSTYERGGLSGRAFIGYNFAHYFGIEGGYGRYARSRYTGTEGIAESTLRYYGREADGVAKFYIPLGTEFVNIYGLAGVSSFWETIKYADAGVPVDSNFAEPTPGTTHQRRTRPIYGGGFIFNLIPHFVMNIEYTQIQQLGRFSTNPLAVPYGALWTLNFAVNLGAFS